MAELNELFGLSWVEPEWSPTFDPEDRCGDIMCNLNSENEVFDVLGTVVTDSSLVGSTPEGTATMMSDTGIQVYEFTVDESVYFFLLADPEVCPSEWWFAHTVNDNETRTALIRDTKAGFGMLDDDLA